jgi:ubiquinone biosynthesis protein UbiJ
MTPSPLAALLARLLSTLSSQTLKLDPVSYPRLEALAGTRIRFDITPPALPGAESGSLLLTVGPESLDLKPVREDADAHAVVRGTLPDIARNFLGARSDAAAGVRIEGDEAALHAVAGLFRDLEPDIAEPLSSLVGRELADELVGAAEAGIAFLKSAAESMTAGLQQQARQTWVNDEAFDQLMDRTDDLQLRIDRLDARVRLAEAERADPAADSSAAERTGTGGGQP